MRATRYWAGTYTRANYSFVPVGEAQAEAEAHTQPTSPWARTHAGAAAAAAPVGAWGLDNGSGKASSGPDGVATHVGASTPGGVGSLFYPGSVVSVPHWPGLDAPGGFAWSMMVQLPDAFSGDGSRGTLVVSRRGRTRTRTRTRTPQGSFCGTACRSHGAASFAALAAQLVPSAWPSRECHQAKHTREITNAAPERRSCLT